MAINKNIKTGYYIADKVSGMAASVFAVSVLPEVVRCADYINKFKIGFYANTINVLKEKADEWIIDEHIKTECASVAKFVSKPENLNYFDEIKNSIIQDSESLRKTALLDIQRMGKMNAKELVSEYFNFMKVYIEKYAPGAITFVYDGVISEYLHKVLAKRYKNTNEIIENHLNSPYTSFMIENERLLLRIREEKDESKRAELIEDYYKLFFYIDASYKYSGKMTPDKIQTKFKGATHTNRDKTGFNLNNLELNQEEIGILELLKISEVIRDQRKKLNLIGNYTMYRFLDEACSRLKIDVNIADRLFWDEYGDLISSPEETTNRIEKREYVTCLWNNSEISYREGVFVEEKIKVDKDIKTFSGTPAARGFAKGNVSIIIGSNEFSKFESGNIIVAEMTRPDFLPIMKLAKAIITDEGGLTCHAAIVARELGIPCIVGTRIGTRVLRDGDLVEVDAERGVVKKLN
ncbi:MAG: PEP-utilizing enzyme [Candidatus Paceibacterota bacterium]|jgi:phosphohistidine swiveling domain-containing protein